MAVRPDLTDDERRSMARRIIDENLYMTLATADGAGVPWVSPVYYAVADYREFVWVSRPDARHSANLASRRELSVVIFDSQVPIGTGQAVYMEATAELVNDGDIDPAIEVFSNRSLEHGGAAWTRDDVLPPAPHRLYRAVASSHFVLSARDERLPVVP
jgi:hypothetical protein